MYQRSSSNRTSDSQSLLCCLEQSDAQLLRLRAYSSHKVRHNRAEYVRRLLVVGELYLNVRLAFGERQVEHLGSGNVR